MERHIDLKRLTLDELAGVINLYPWFASARKELCRRMTDIGGEGWGREQYADAAMYRVVVSTFADRASAAAARDAFKAKYPERKDFQGSWLLYRVK